jgi:hypothetical protein
MSGVLEQFINKNSDKAEKWKDIIEEMFSSRRYDYADDTLEGIMDYIEENDSITDKQIEAVKNIKARPSQNNYGEGDWRDTQD